MNLRTRAENDLKTTLEGKWGFPVVLVDPDGNEQTKSANEPTKDLMGQILYDHRTIDADSGMEILVNTPVITLRKSSLNRIPKFNETWKIKFTRLN